MDIITQDQSQTIIKLAVDELNFMQDNEFWGPALLDTFMEDEAYYKPSKEESSLRYFTYHDSIQKATLVLVRANSQSPVARAAFVRDEGSPLSETQISKANAQLQELFA